MSVQHGRLPTVQVTLTTYNLRGYLVREARFFELQRLHRHVVERHGAFFIGPPDPLELNLIDCVAIGLHNDRAALRVNGKPLKMHDARKSSLSRHTCARPCLLLIVAYLEPLIVIDDAIGMQPHEHVELCYFVSVGGLCCGEESVRRPQFLGIRILQVDDFHCARVAQSGIVPLLRQIHVSEEVHSTYTDLADAREMDADVHYGPMVMVADLFQMFSH